jgi:hypothetical protein
MTSPEPFSDGVANGIVELRQEFGAVAAASTGDGGAHVTVEHVALPETLSKPNCWVGFALPYNYDDVQVYGHFVPADLCYADGRSLAGQGLQTGQVWQEQAAIKISRNSPRWRSGVDSATLKLLKVIEWLGGRS